MADPVARARDLFRSSYGADPVWAASAPGRVNLIGEHTDYNDGFVLPMALEQRTAVVLGPSGDRLWWFVSEQRPGAVSFDAAGLADARRRDWTSYPRGVIAGFADAGLAAGPMRVAASSDVPVGGGLSSSAALEVAAAGALESALGVALDPWDKILLCQKAEHGFAGVPCGFMDQAASVLGRAGHALLLDCRSRLARPVPFDGGSCAVLVMNSMVRHELAGGEYARRRASCAAAVAALRRAGFADVRSLRDATAEMLGATGGGTDAVTVRRARHVLSENGRTLAAVAALASGDPAAAGALMTASHASLRDDYEVSCPEVDLLVDLACGAAGVYGARMTGGGFGGCVVAVVEAGGAEAAGRAVAGAYHAATGLTPAWFVTRGGGGARAEPAGR